MSNNKKAIIGIESKENEEHPEVLLANQISIMDYAHQNNFIINYEDEKTARIQDVLTEDEITVHKENNTWTIPDEGKLYGGRTIRFISRMLGMDSTAAIDFLVENREKYKSSKEYNEQYGGKNQVIAEEKNESTKQEEANKEEPKLEEENVCESLKATSEIPTKPRYTKEQLAEIIMGTKKGLDIKVYDNIMLTHQQMHELRLGLENGVNLSKFAVESVPPDYIKEVRIAAQEGLDIKPFALKKKECVYSPSQVKEIRLAMRGLDKEQTKLLMKPDLSSEVMRELRLGMQDGLDMKSFGNGVYTAKDVHTIRMHMMVKQIIENIKQKFALLFEQIHDAIQQRIKNVNPQLEQKEVVNETDFVIKDIVTELYENIEESISEKSVEDKKEILAGVFQKIVAIGNAIEEVYPEQDKVTCLEQSYDKINERIQEKTLSEHALDALKEDYMEKFNQSEFNYNVEMADLSQQVMNEANLTSEQKKELLEQTIGKQLGEQMLDKIMEYIPETPKQNPNVVVQEVIEYLQDFELEQ